MLILIPQAVPYSVKYRQRYMVSLLTAFLNSKKKKLKLNSMAFSPQANYTDRATAACRPS
jgi:hypothetical protein